MILILMMAAVVGCSALDPLLQAPSGGMPEGMEFCNQGRLKKLCHKGVFQPTAVKGPVALTFCPGTLKKLCPIKPVAMRFSSGPVTSIPVGWKVCRDNLGLCPATGYNTRRRRPAMSRPSSFPLDSRVGRPSKRPIHFPSSFPTTFNKGMVPCRYRAGMCFPDSEEPKFVESRPMTRNKGMVPCKDRMGMCFPENDSSEPSFEQSQPMMANKGMVPCKDTMGMCFPESEEKDSSESGYVESQPMLANKGMVPCKDTMGMCFPDN